MRHLITGGANGIGLAVARMLAGADASLLLVDIDPAALEWAACSLRETGARVETMPLDIAGPDAPSRCVARALKAFGGLDTLFSNVGRAVRKPLAEMTVEEWDGNMNLSIRATWLLAREAYPSLKASRGAMVATASVSGLNPHPNLGPYSTAKAATIMLCQQLALEWANDGIRVNTVSPGITQTLNMSRYIAQPGVEKRYLAAVPAGRIAEPAEIAQAVCFLLSDRASFITGANLVIDGGLSLSAMRQLGD